MAVLHGFFNVVAAMVDRLGWGGALVVLIFFFVQYNGTADQKQAIIDKFVLGKESDGIYPYACLGAFGVVVFMGQNYFWRRRTKTLQAEIDRLSKWKSDHQQNALGNGLHHSQ